MMRPSRAETDMLQKKRIAPPAFPGNRYPRCVTALLLVLVHFLELGLDDLFLGFRASIPGRTRRTRTR